MWWMGFLESTSFWHSSWRIWTQRHSWWSTILKWLHYGECTEQGYAGFLNKLSYLIFTDLGCVVNNIKPLLWLSAAIVVVHFFTDFCYHMCCFLWRLTDSKPKKLGFPDFRSLHILYNDRYLSSWFVLDVASTVPFEAIAFVFTGRYGKGFVYSMLNMLRLWRLRRVSALFARYISHWIFINSICFEMDCNFWMDGTALLPPYRFRFVSCIHYIL